MISKGCMFLEGLVIMVNGIRLSGFEISERVYGRDYPPVVHFRLLQIAIRPY
jgi:hypothetical protein